MRSFVKGQLRAPSEGFWTNCAFIGFVPCVGTHVYQQIWMLGYPLATNCANVRFVPCVCSQMLSKNRRPCKTFATDLKIPVNNKYNVLVNFIIFKTHLRYIYKVLNHCELSYDFLNNVEQRKFYHKFHMRAVFLLYVFAYEWLNISLPKIWLNVSKIIKISTLFM